MFAQPEAFGSFGVTRGRRLRQEGTLQLGFEVQFWTAFKSQTYQIHLHLQKKLGLS